MYESTNLRWDVRLCLYTKNNVVDTYFAAITVKVNDKSGRWLLNLTLPMIYFRLILCSDTFQVL